MRVLASLIANASFLSFGSKRKKQRPRSSMNTQKNKHAMNKSCHRPMTERSLVAIYLALLLLYCQAASLDTSQLFKTALFLCVLTSLRFNYQIQHLIQHSFIQPSFREMTSCFAMIHNFPYTHFASVRLKN